MDLEDLLAPISAAEPCGTDLSLSSDFDAIQEMRREDDPTLDQGEWVASLKVADWPGVSRACTEMLHQRSKDLRLAGWFTEAQAHLRGFEGLAHGLDLCAGLLEQHWPTVHPQPEDGEYDGRIGHLRWLSTKVEELARQIVLVPRSDAPTKGYSLLDAEAARTRRLAGEAQGGGAGNLPTVESLARMLAQAGLNAYETQGSRVQAALAAWSRLTAVAERELGNDAPVFTGARRALESARDELARLGQEAHLGAGQAAEPPTRPDDAASHEAPAPGVRLLNGPIQSRAQALEQLRQVAEYFRQAEPHSPVAYLADKAARWGTMPLHDWLRSVVKEPGALSHVEELLGIERPEDGLN